jgi:excinuclease ABC subunit C
VLEEKLKNLPGETGVYLMKDAQGKIIYVGKALNIKNRVRSYFFSRHADSPRTRALVKNIHDLEYILTDSEIEALILESNLIKEHKPKYNVRLTDDKNYPYLRVSVQEPFPRLEIVRARKKDGARYFGPYTDTGAVNETLRLIKKIFPLRSCKQAAFAGRDQPCLNYHINRCAAPCRGGITPDEYRKMVDEVLLFLEGKREDLVKTLKSRMEKAAEELEFEKAAVIRDQLQAVEKVVARQKIISGRAADMDVINCARSVNLACVEIFFVREGKLLGRDHFFLEGAGESGSGEILGSFIKQYYSEAGHIPAEVLLPQPAEEERVLETWLSGKRGSRVRLQVPKHGEKYALVEMAGKNALESLQLEVGRRAVRDGMSREALAQIAQYLGLPGEPGRIECFDVSHLQGAETVASMVVFEDGRASPSQYRRFRIRNVEGPDDFASMAEVIERRFIKAAEGDEKFKDLPDLVVVDGGKGQLSSARQAMDRLGYSHITAVGLAKENEWVYVEGSSDPLILPRNSQGLYLLQRIRDEAHRFAVSYHRLLRGRRSLSSALDEIPGIGPKRKAALLKHYGMSLKKLLNASEEELSRVEGINRETARQVWEYFHPAEIKETGK